MFQKILEIIIYIILVYFNIKVCLKIYKIYKQTENQLEQAIYLVAMISLAIPYILWFLDIFNIPSKFNYTNNVNKSDWLNFLGTYLSAMISSLIGAVFLIYATREQIESSYEDNLFLNKETHRIQNLPCLKFNIEDEVENFNDFSKTKWLSHIYDDNYESAQFSLHIRNVGLNSMRKLYLSIISDILKDDVIIDLSTDGCIDKNEIKKKDFFINSLPDGNYILFVNVYYQDLMKNWYEQKVKIFIETSNIHNPKRVCNKKLKVYDEFQIDIIPEKIQEFIDKNNK